MEIAVVGLIGLVALGFLILYAARFVIYILGSFLMSGVVTALFTGIAMMTGKPMKNETIAVVWLMLLVLFIVSAFLGWLGEVSRSYHRQSHKRVTAESDEHGQNAVVSEEEAIAETPPEARGGSRILGRPMGAIGRGVAWLKGLASGIPGIPVKLGEEVLVGRSLAATIRIDNRHVSHQHVKLSLAPDGAVEVIDLGSVDGTYINRQRLVPNRHYRLNAGDRLILGSEDVVYQVA
jgi:hypothetical protein